MSLSANESAKDKGWRLSSIKDRWWCSLATWILCCIVARWAWMILSLVLADVESVMSMELSVLGFLGELVDC